MLKHQLKLLRQPILVMFFVVFSVFSTINHPSCDAAKWKSYTANGCKPGNLYILDVQKGKVVEAKFYVVKPDSENPLKDSYEYPTKIISQKQQSLEIEIDFTKAMKGRHDRWILHFKKNFEGKVVPATVKDKRGKGAELKLNFTPMTKVPTKKATNQPSS